VAIPKQGVGRSVADTAADAAGTGQDTEQPEGQPVARVRAAKSSGLQWTRLQARTRRNVIAIIQGEDQSGKTHWAFGAPEPIALLTFDPDNFDGVMKHYGHKDIQMASFEIPKGLVATSELARVARVEADRYHDHYIDACKSSQFRTIIMDREDEAWELFRYEEFDGKSSAKSHHYTQLNASYRAMIKAAHQHGKNLIMIDAVSAEYKSDKPTGGMKRNGFKHLGMLSQVTLEAQVDAYDNFKIQVVRCRDDATKNGMVLDGAVISDGLGDVEGIAEEWPINEAGDYVNWGLEFATTMAYLIGGKPSEWK